MPLHGLTIAFDLDGTLVDTAPDLIGSLNLVLQECDLPALPWLAPGGSLVMAPRRDRTWFRYGRRRAGRTENACLGRSLH